MTSNLGRKLYANFWETANPLFVRSPRANRVPSVHNAVDSTLLSKNCAKRAPLPNGKPKHFTRRFASGSFFVLGASPNSTVETGTTCAKVPEKFMCHSGHRYHFDRSLLRNLTRNAWKRSIHTSNGDQSRAEIPKGPGESDNNNPVHFRNSKSTENQDAQPSNPKTSNSPLQQHFSGPLNRHLIDRLPHMPQLPQLHRPSKEELLAAATGFWSRLKVRFKWFSIRSVRPFNFDEIAALFSWVLLGHIVWVVLGTTTFFSLVILAINTVFAQGMIASLYIYMLECHR